MEGLPKTSESIAEIDNTKKKLSRRARRSAETADSSADSSTENRSRVRIQEKLRRSLNGSETVKSSDESHPAWQAEQIGQVLITHAESSDVSKKSPKPEIETAPAMPLEKHIETLDHADLLELSGKIVVDGRNLKQLYEAHQIGEHALRRLIAEQLGGGDIRKALRAELTQHEMDFERDPILRDRAHQSPASIRQSGMSLDVLLEKAEAVLGNVDNKAISSPEDLKMHAENEMKTLQRKQLNRRLLDLAMVSFIAILLVLVLLLAIVRH
jgi:hypothetical protein